MMDVCADTLVGGVRLLAERMNADGSADLYFGPKAPAGLESNWVDTSASKGWFVWFRFYGPREPFFDQSWQLPDFERVK